MNKELLNDEQRTVLSQIPYEVMLRIAKENDTIDEAIICDIYMRMQNQKYLDCHNHKIWQDKSGNWLTYLDDSSSKRGYVRKSRKSLNDLEKLIIGYYKQKEENPTIEEIFNLWIERKRENNEVRPQTLDKYKCYFKRFFKGEDFSKKRIRKVTEDDLDEFIRYNIRRFELTNKSYAQLRLIIRGMFKMAKLKKFTEISISTFFQDIDLPSSMFRKVIKDKRKEVFWVDEIPLIKDYLFKSDNPNDWGVALSFETGMRVGETSALEFTDFSEDFVHVQKTEVHYYSEELKKNVREVQALPKTEAGNRYIILTDRAKALYIRICACNPNGRYLFERNGKRVSYNRFNKRLRKACKELNIDNRTMHKIRKTYGTTLLNNNVPESLVAEQIGHADISTTKKFYYVENQDDESKIETIKNALL